MAYFKKAAAAVIASSVLLLTACEANFSGKVSESSVSVITVTEAFPDEENIIRSNQASIVSGKDGEFNTEPFSSYTFDFSDSVNKYMITAELNSSGDAFELTLENSSFEYSTFEIKAPENYTLNIPFSQDEAGNVCDIIKNTLNDTPVPDILEFVFYINNFDNENLSYAVTKYYSVKNNELCEIDLYEMNENGISEDLEYCSDGQLFHTEPLVFMPSPEIKTDGTNVDAEIYTYTFDPDKMTMVKNIHTSSYEESPLYYGYKVRAVADYIAKYFTTTSLNVTDYENYVEVPSLNSEYSDYFFRVDDERFSTTDELKQFARQYFSEKLVSDMFNNAPQKYRDINGELYTIVGDGGIDFTLGTLTITDFEESGNTITYHTKQEKFSEEGKFLNFIDGGDFSVERNTDGSFIVTQYRLSY